MSLGDHARSGNSTDDGLKCALAFPMLRAVYIAVRAASAVLGIVAAVPSLTFAQGALGASGFSPARTMHSIAPFEHVDPFSGNLILSFTDLALPGNAGLDLVINRVYNSKIHTNFDETPNHFKQRTWMGLGWSLHFGRVLHATSLSPGKTVVEMSDGSGHALYNSLPGDPHNSFGTWVTTDLWRYDRSTHTLRMTNGRTYIFGWVGIGGGPDGQVRYVTEIRDPYDNRITFEYFQSHEGPTDGVKRIVQHLGNGQQREVTFGVTPLTYGYALSSMTYAGRTWSYTHVEPPSHPTQVWLMATSGPAPGTSWTFTYRTVVPGPELLTVTGPQGGQLRYEYLDVNWVVWDRFVSTRGVEQRQAVGPGLTTGTWTFAYEQGAFKNMSVVTGPCSRQTYRFRAVGLHQGQGMDEFVGWLAGALDRTTTEELNGTVLEEHIFNWAPSAIISNDAVEGLPEIGTGLPTGLWADDNVKRALLSTTIVDRGGAKWQTLHHYATAKYNDFLQPWQTWSWDVTKPQVARVITRTFWDQAAAGLYLPAPVQLEQVWVGSEHLESSRTFESTTGFVTTTTGRGTTTTFTRTPQGNVATITDALDKTTTLTHTWGVVSQIQTPLLTTARAINTDGTVASETVGGLLTTTYAYDALMRPVGVQPPGGTVPFQLAYEPNGADPDGAVYIQNTRGSTYTRTYPDAFGRVIRTADPDGLRARTVFDPCGRVTFQSALYTTGSDLRGTTTSYDALGRVTSTSTVNESGTPTSTTTFAYDGIHVTVTDPEQRVTRYEHYSDTGPAGGQLVKVIDAAGQMTTYTYHVSGALASTSGPVSGPRSWTYDAHGRLSGETHPEAGTTTYVPNAVGNLASLTNGAGQTLTFTYDNNHRLIGRDGPGTASDVAISYDTLGRVATESVGGQVVTTYTYDTATGRPATRLDLTGGIHFQSDYTFDPLDRLTAIKYPSWHVAGYEYAASGRLTRVIWRGQTFANDFNYDDAGRLTSYKTGPVTHTVAYDERDRPTQVAASSPAAGTALDLGYQYNNVSLVTALTDHRLGQSQTFQYDALNRLTQATGAYGPLAWQYDAAGNRTVESRTNGSLNYAYDSTTHRLATVTGPQSATFAYDAAGRTSSVTTSDGTSTYGYTPAGLLTTVSTPDVSVAQIYDAAEWRVRSDVTVGGVTSQRFTLRSLGGQVLSEYERLCVGCPHRWVRDVIYAGGRPLGAFKGDLSPPTVAWDSATSQAPESVAASRAVRVTVPYGQSVPAPIVVSVSTIDTGGGSATAGADYTPLHTTIPIPAGTASGTTFPVSVAIVDDPYDEPNETVHVRITGATHAVVGTPDTWVHTIVDNDDPPTLTVGNVSVVESAGTAVLTLQLSPASGYPIVVNFATVDGTAKAGRDYTAVSGQLAFAPMELSKTVSIPILNDTYAEPTETFSVQLTAVNPLVVTMPAASPVVEITDDDGPWVDIDPALPGDYFARAWTPGEDSYIQIYNPHDVGVTARVTYIQAEGQGVRRTYALAARQRLGLHVPSDAFVSGQGVQGSAVVQTLDASRPLVAELVHYAGSGWQTGEATEGVSPALSWTLAEGATGLSVGFQEWITVFNPTSQPVTATLKYYTASGLVHTQTQNVPSGPGLWGIHVNALWPQIEHSTVVTAVGEDSGTAVPLVVERRTRWGNGLEGHSSAGASTAATAWHFAEGSKGLFDTYVAVFNPGPNPAQVVLHYRHENGTLPSEQVTVPAQRRVVVAPSAPVGGFGIQVWTQNGQPIVAERMVYAGTNWTIGHAGPGVTGGHTLWRFAEGSSVSGLFETYFLITNLSTTPTTVTLTYRQASGTVIGTDTLPLPASTRGTVWANGVTGGQDFTTEVTSPQAIVVERVMYWPTGGSLLSGGGGDVEALSLEPAPLGQDGAALEPSPPWLDTGGGPPQPYTLTEGVPGPTEVLTDDPASLVIGKPLPGSLWRQATDGTLEWAPEGEGATMQSSGGLPWYGSHLAVGKKP
jgi:YD repeat-containing protein